MIDQNRIVTALNQLTPWLETWRDENGAYNGFVVHRTEAKRMDRVHDTAWTQSAMIRGYGNLYRKSREPRWGQALTLAADLLADLYDPETGRIRHTGHEDDRFQSLVSCALGVCALLSVSDLVNAARRKKYVNIAQDHARRYWFDVLWVEREGAFKFSEIDYFCPHEDRFVVNFNTMAAEALLAIYSATGEPEFREKAVRVGQWLIKHWELTQAVNHEILNGRTTVEEDPYSEWMSQGGFSYQFSASRRVPDNYVTLYNGLSLRGLWALYQATKDERFAQIIRAQSRYILAMRDPGTKLFYHTAWGGRIEKNPQFVAGAGMTLLGLHEAMPLIGHMAVPEDTISAILSRAYPNGAYPGFIGKNDTGHPGRNSGGLVWEDVASSPNWNAQLFEYLTRLIKDPSRINLELHAETVRFFTKRFVYVDSPGSVAIASWWPPRSWGVYLYRKNSHKARICVYPADLYRHIRAMGKGLKQ